MKLGPTLTLLQCIAVYLHNVSAMVIEKPRSTFGSAKVMQSEQKVSRSSRLDPWREFEELRESDLDRTKLAPFFKERPRLIVDRLYKVTKTLYRAREEWQLSEDPVNQVEETANDDPASIMDKGGLQQSEVDRAQNLCDAISLLGPVAVKMGQTMSQRPDLVGVEAAKALKTLQTKNKPFENELAYSVLHDSLEYWEGPLAPGIQFNNSNIDPNGPTLFAKMTPDPIACASLGQVYRATMHDGTDVAVKIQRPDALAVLSKDAQCFRLVYRAKGIIDQVKAKFESSGDSSGLSEDDVRGETTIGSVIDRVARDIKKELDYRIEAKNSVRFRESLGFLGFVTTPTVVQTTDRVLVTEWIPGRHLDNLSKNEGLAMTRMAVEATTASLVLTGFVHADPHEGNLMLHDDGRIVFLDFGLMSEVDINTMEGFARGIQSLLSENWSALTEAFADVGFVNTPVMHRVGLQDNWQVDPEYGLPQLTDELAAAMQNTEGGESRFGALATVLNKKISPNWLVYTPPYVILLIRTFLTLEGIAASVDPDFNIYEMAMPWAVRRSLSPSTEKGINVFRATLLTDENKIQWKRLLELTNANGEETALRPVEKQEAEGEQQPASQKAAMKDAVGSLLGSSDGKALRRALKDLDSTDLIVKLSSREGRPLLEKAAKQVTLGMKSKKNSRGKTFQKDEDIRKEQATTQIENRRPMSDEYAQLQLQQSKRRKRVIRVLLVYHVKRCLFQWQGLKASMRLLLVGIKVFLKTLLKNKLPRETKPDYEPSAK